MFVRTSIVLALVALVAVSSATPDDFGPAVTNSSSGSSNVTESEAKITEANEVTVPQTLTVEATVAFGEAFEALSAAAKVSAKTDTTKTITDKMTGVASSDVNTTNILKDEKLINRRNRRASTAKYTIEIVFNSGVSAATVTTGLESLKLETALVFTINGVTYTLDMSTAKQATIAQAKITEATTAAPVSGKKAKKAKKDKSGKAPKEAKAGKAAKDAKKAAKDAKKAAKEAKAGKAGKAAKDAKKAAKEAKAKKGKYGPGAEGRLMNGTNSNGTNSSQAKMDMGDSSKKAKKDKKAKKANMSSGAFHSLTSGTTGSIALGASAVAFVALAALFMTRRNKATPSEPSERTELIGQQV
jgi:hypothetical protein